MSVVDPAQTSFVGGELSPRLWGRFDSETYKSALALCENFGILPQGPLLMRGGSDHVLPLVGDNRTRLVAMRMVNGQDYLVELFDYVARLYSITGAQAQAVSVTTTELVANGSFAGSLGWTASNPTVSFDLAPGRCVLDTNGSGDPPADTYIRQKVTVPPSAGSVTLTFRVSGLDVNGRVQVIVDKYAVGGGYIARLLDDTSDPANGGADPAASALETKTFALGALPNCDLWIDIWQPAVDGKVVLDDVSIVATSSSGAQFNIATPWSADEVKDTRFASETGRDRTIFVHGVHAPWFLKYNAAAAWDFNTIAFGAKPAEWGGTNWPAAVEVHDGRVFYAGEPNAKNRIVGSKAGEPDNLNVGTANPADAIDLKVATKGALRWLRSMRGLLAGSDLGEHSLSGSAGPIANGDMQARTESAYGSASIQAISVGSHVLYVTKDRRRIRSMTFDLGTDGWESEDITFAAEHATAGLIREIHHALTPDSLVIAVLDTGELRVCTFEPEKKLAAWWRVSLASGLVRSAAVSQGEQGTFLWMAVERNGAMFLERLPLSEFAVTHHLDGAVSYPAVDLGSDLPVPHLANGATVGVVVDGANYPNQVVASGKAIMPASGALVTVGLAFRGKAKTLPVEAGGARGTAQGSKRRRVKTVALMNDSALPLVNGERAADRSPSTAMNTPEGRWSGECEARGLGYDDRGQVTIEQDLPLRTEILAIYGVVSASEV